MKLQFLNKVLSFRSIESRIIEYMKGHNAKFSFDAMERNDKNNGEITFIPYKVKKAMEMIDPSRKTTRSIEELAQDQHQRKNVDNGFGPSSRASFNHQNHGPRTKTKVNKISPMN